MAPPAGRREMSDPGGTMITRRVRERWRMVDWLKKAPTAVVITLIVVLGVLVLGVLTAFVYLQARGVDTAPLRQWISAVGIPLLSLLMGVNTVASVQSARSASNAEDQTNGQLHARDARIAQLEQVVRAAGLVVPASEPASGGKADA